MSGPVIALLQSRHFPTKEEALAEHEKLIREAAVEGAQIICTQEFFSPITFAMSRIRIALISPRSFLDRPPNDFVISRLVWGW